MTRRSDISCGHEEAWLSSVERRQFTRRAFGGLVLGGLSFVGPGCTDVARGESIITTVEPDGPDRLPRRRVKVLDTEISYVDTGDGEPVVFLHGNPTWSYQWRNIIPHISSDRRCLAPDLVGMGWSGKSPSKAYRFVDHVRYIDAWLEVLKAIAYFEAIILPRRWEDYTDGRDRQFRAFRSPEGERLVLDENMFVEVALPRGMLRKLTEEEMEAYRAPYRDRDRRLPTLVWPRELPIEGVPEDVVAIVEQNAQWLAASTSLPKLFINGDPGASISGRIREFCRTLPNQSEITVKGLHHLQEDSPKEIGEALRAFVLSIRT